MDCLLYYRKLYESNYRSHYESVHNVDLTDPHFRKLFEPVSNAADKKCEYCSRQFSTHQEKKNHVFLVTITAYLCRLVAAGQRLALIFYAGVKL